MVDNGINRYGRLAGLSVADDKLALAATDGYHGVYGFESGLQGFVDGLAINNARCLAVKWHLEFFAFYFVASIQWLSQGVDDAAKHILVYEDRCYTSCTLYALPLLDAF